MYCVLIKEFFKSLHYSTMNEPSPHSYPTRLVMWGILRVPSGKFLVISISFLSLALPLLIDPKTWEREWKSHTYLSGCKCVFLLWGHGSFSNMAGLWRTPRGRCKGSSILGPTCKVSLWAGEWGIGGPSVVLFSDMGHPRPAWPPSTLLNSDPWGGGGGGAQPVSSHLWPFCGFQQVGSGPAPFCLPHSDL